MSLPHTPLTAPQKPVQGVIIVEDDQDLRESLVTYLTLAGHTITGVGSALQFYQAIAEQNYALALLDVGLPDQNGLVLAEYLRNNTTMRIIMLTARTSLEDKLAGYNSGADLYMVKPLDFQELSAAISSMLGRIEPATAEQNRSDTGRMSSPGLPSLSKAENPAWMLERSTRTLHTPQGEVIELTGKEFDLIACLASEGNEAVSRQAILKALLYQNDEFSNRSLESLIYRLRTKMAPCCSSVPIKTTHGVGYCFSAPLMMR